MAYGAGEGYGREYNQGNIANVLDQYSKSLDPYYNRASAQIANTMGGRGTLYGTPGSNKLQLMQNEKLGKLGELSSNLMQTGMQGARQERLLGEERTYEQPFREASLTGQYQGSPTAAYQAWAMPYVTSGNLGSSVLGNMLQGNVKTDREISPEWWSAVQSGFENPYKQAMYYAYPEQYERVYGTPTATPGGYNTNYNYYDPQGKYRANQNNSYYSSNGVRAY